MKTKKLLNKDSYESPVVLASELVRVSGVICASVILDAEAPSYDVSDDDYNW